MASPGGDDDEHLFAGVRFVLVGFDHVSESQYRSEMVRRAGADAGRFGNGCTHVVACGRVYDDPACVAARAEGSKVVSELWVDDSLDRGVLADADRVIYWPVRDLNGIPGSESLHICLTGYQRNDREDIMKMVSLMGAQFSKPLIAHVVTHLICYKCEGEKYELAKRVNIKLVNHRWLEDCLKSWEILPVDDYSKSSWELEIMEAQAKDSEDEAEDLDQKSFNGRSSVKCTPNRKNSAGNSANPDVNAPIQSPIIPSFNREMVVERHLNTPGQIRKTEDAGNTSRLAISASADVDSPIKTPFILSGNRGEAAVRNLKSPNQIWEAEYKYVGTRTLDITTGPPGTPSSSRMAVSANHHFHSLNETLTIANGNSDNVARKHLDNQGHIDVSKAYFTTPSRENWSANVLDSSNVDRGQRQEDGATGNLSAEAFRSNVVDELANPEVNLKSGGNATPNNINSLSCSRKSLQKSLSPEGHSIRQRAEGNTSRTDSNISSLGKGEKKSAEFADIQNLKGDENVQNVDGLDAAYAHKRKCLTSPASLKPQNGDLASETGTLNSPFVSRLSDTSERAITSSVGTDPTEATNVDLGKQQSGSSISKQSRYRRTSVKHGGPIDGVKLPEYSTSDRNVESLPKARSLKAMVENRCTTSPAMVQDGKRNPGFSFQNKNEEVAQASSNAVNQYGALLMHEIENAHTKDRAPDISLHGSKNLQLVSCSGNDGTEMTDALDVNRNEAAVASNFKFEKVVSVDNVKAGLKQLPGASSNVQCETSYPKKVATPKARNAGSKRPRSTSMEVDGSVVNNGKAVVSESEPDKMIPHEHAGATSKNGSSSASAAECKTISPKKVPISVVRNTISKRSHNVHTKVSNAQLASNLELSKAISQENIEADPKKVLSSVSADEHQRISPKKLPNTRVRNAVAKRSQKSDTNTTGESSVDKTEMVAADPLFYDLFSSENVEDCPKKLSSSASADVCETLSPKNVSTARVRKVVAKRKIKAVEDESGSKHDKIGSAVVSAAEAVSPKRIEESSCSINKATADQDSQKANKDGTRDVSRLFSKDTVTVDKSGLHSSKLRCRKRNKALDSDHEKNRQDRGNLSSKSNGRTGSLNSKFDSKSMQCSTDILNQHRRIKGNGAGTLITLEPACFILSGHRQQRRDYRTILRHLKGRVCRDSHHWSYQATHFLIPDPLRRTEKFFAAAAAGRWILKSDYLTSCNEAGKFLDEEPFEWFGTGLNDGETISFEAPRKWRILRQEMGHGAFYGMQIIVYGQLISPSLDTLKRAVRAGDGTILATSPPYTRFLNSGVDFAVVSASMPSADAWVQEFMSHNIPCVSADYLVEYVCKPGCPLDRHVLFKTNFLANKSLDKLLKNQEVATDKPEPLEDGDPDNMSCSVCGSTDRAEVMLICGDEDGAAGCGVGMHIDCCDPLLEAVPDDDWLCPKCDISKVTKKTARGTGSKSRRSKRR